MSIAFKEFKPASLRIQRYHTIKVGNLHEIELWVFRRRHFGIFDSNPDQQLYSIALERSFQQPIRIATDSYRYILSIHTMASCSPKERNINIIRVSNLLESARASCTHDESMTGSGTRASAMSIDGVKPPLTERCLNTASSLQ